MLTLPVTKTWSEPPHIAKGQRLSKAKAGAARTRQAGRTNACNSHAPGPRGLRPEVEMHGRTLLTGCRPRTSTMPMSLPTLRALAG